MGTLDFLKGLKDRTIDAVTYELLERNFQMLEDNNRLLKEKTEVVEEENVKLKEEIESLRTELRTVREQLSQLVEESQYLTKKGVAFRRKSDGSFEETPFCPNCHSVMGTPPPRGHFVCPSCNYVTEIRIVPEDIARQLSNASRTKN